MSPDPAKESFRKKAPLLEIDDLTEVIIEKILTEELLERAESVWIRKSFADPDKEIDSKDTPSDLDVFVVVPSWDKPLPDSGLAIVAPQVEVSAAYEESAEGSNWTSKDGKWESAEEAWEQIPKYVQKSLIRSTEYGFYATESDVESGIVRPYDITICNEEQFEVASKPDGEFCIWRSDS